MEDEKALADLLGDSFEPPSLDPEPSLSPTAASASAPPISRAAEEGEVRRRRVDSID